jgi:hypothetical protein
MTRFPRIFWLAPLLLLGLAACKQKETAPLAATATPQGAVTAAVQSLKAGDLKALVDSQIPPEHIEKLRAEWKADMAKEVPTPEKAAEFQTMMADLTGPDAEARMYEQLEPRIEKFEREMAPQMPMMIGMGRGLVVGSIQENKELTDAQKDQAMQSVDALAKWLETTKFTDRDLARKAIAQTVEAARGLDLSTLDQARSLSFDDAMVKGSIAFRGLKNVLETYGFSLDKVLDSVKTEVAKEAGAAATVKVSYEMMGKPLAFETEMVKVGDRWYGKQTLERLNKPRVETTEEATADEEAGEAVEPAAAGQG